MMGGPAEAREVAIDVAAAGTAEKRPGRKGSWAALVRWSILGLFAASVAAIIGLVAWPARPKPNRNDTLLILPKTNGEGAVAGREPAPLIAPAVEPRAEVPPAEAPPAAPARLKLAELLERLEGSIVKIESGGPEGRTQLGSGFVIDERGLVATNYHVIDEATLGHVRFKSGVEYEIAGYAAVAPEQDLAILKIKDPPPDLTPLALAAEADPRPLSPVVAVGHPLGMEYSPFDGKVSRVVLSRELPAASQRFLSRHLSAEVDLRWIQHTATISAGNSGGPLLDEAGRVLGVNTWYDRQTNYAYALHARYVARLLGRLLPEVAPLERYASAEARLTAEVARLSPERLERLYQECQKLGWRPSAPAEYELLQQLAWALTYPQIASSLEGGEPLDEALAEALAKSADRVESRLKQQRLDAFGQLTLINEFAAGQIGRPRAGLFLFGTVERTVEGDRGARALLMKLTGFEQMLLVPLDGTLFSAPAGAHCLVLGIDSGRSVRYGENPLRLVSAHVVFSRTILPLRD